MSARRVISVQHMFLELGVQLSARRARTTVGSYRTVGPAFEGWRRTLEVTGNWRNLAPFGSNSFLGGGVTPWKRGT